LFSVRPTATFGYLSASFSLIDCNAIAETTAIGVFFSNIELAHLLSQTINQLQTTPLIILNYKKSYHNSKFFIETLNFPQKCGFFGIYKYFVLINVEIPPFLAEIQNFNEKH
jgi:hypothetical protein